jgi:hypothetical protein
MKIASTCLLVGLFAFAAAAQLTPGAVVRDGDAFPVVADFNGDGLDDLIQGRNVLLSDGTSFSAPIDLGLPQGESVIGVLDVNGDGILDLLTSIRGFTAPAGPSGITAYHLFVGNASHRYVSPIVITTAGQPYIADADGDGRDDLLIFTSVFSGMRDVAVDLVVLRSRGDGTFETLDPLRIPGGYPQIDSQSRVLESDLNHDGIPDLLFRSVHDLVVLRGVGGGRFVAETHFLPWGYGGWSTRLADIDGDGNDDVILAMVRGVRVFFGDGHGNFPRTAWAAIPKTHDLVGLPAGLAAPPDNVQNPKDLAIGHFTRADRMQIAGGTVEGDLAVISYEQGALKVVLQIATEFWLPMVRSGKFHNDGVSDVYAMGTLIWGDQFPRPRLFNGSKTTAPALLSVPVRSRRHVVGAPADATTAFQIQMRGDCISDVSDRFIFPASGFFRTAHSGDVTIEAIFDPEAGGAIPFRISAPFAKEPAIDAFIPWTTGYIATANVLTDCGWKAISLTASKE